MSQKEMRARGHLMGDRCGIKICFRALVKNE